MVKRCPECGKEVSDEESECLSCGASIAHDDDDSTQMDEDDLEMLNRLKSRILSAQAELEGQVGGGIEDLSKRVGGVLESVERIENIEKMQPREYVTGDGMEADLGEPSGELEYGEPGTEISTYQEQGTEVLSRKDIEVEGEISPEAGKELENKGEAAEEARSDAAQEERGPHIIDEGVMVGDEPAVEQVGVSSDSPYAEVEAIGPPYEDLDISIYPSIDIMPLVDNLINLTRIKREKGDIRRAMELLEMANDLAPHDDRLIKEMDALEKVLTGEVVPEPEEKKTKVLAEELEDTISQLEKKADSAISQLRRLLKTTDIPEKDQKEYVLKLNEAAEASSAKMFSKAHTIACEAIDGLKGRIKESMDLHTQANIDRARELVEELEGDPGDIGPEVITRIKGQFEEAVKAYLTGEFERSSLLTRGVISQILDLRDPEAVRLKERIKELRGEISKSTDLSLFRSELAEIDNVLKIAENKIEGRDYSDAKKLLDRIGGNVEDVKRKGELYLRAKEMRIKVNNRFERLTSIDDEVKAEKNKVKYLNQLFDKDRFEDLLTLGEELDSRFKEIENKKKIRDVDEVIEGLSEVMERASQLDGAVEYLSRYERLKEKVEKGEMAGVSVEGRKLLDEINLKFKTQFLERAKKVSDLTVRSRVSMSRLRTMRIETSSFEKRIRKAKNLMKGGNYKEGIAIMEEANSGMERILKEKERYFKDYTSIYRDSLEVVMDRYRDDPNMHLIKERRVPIMRKLTEMGRYRKVMEMYRELEGVFPTVLLTDEKKDRLEEELNQTRFEIYSKKDEGEDIAEPLEIYNEAQKSFGEGNVVLAEYLIQVGRRYLDTMLRGNVGKKASA